MNTAHIRRKVEASAAHVIEKEKPYRNTTCKKLISVASDRKIEITISSNLLKMLSSFFIFRLKEYYINQLSVAIMFGMVWIKLIAAAGLITASGVVLTIFADRLGDKLKISGAFIGLLILSTVSSLPELGATVSVVSYIGKPDLAAGNIFGSNTFNMLILAILDFILIGSASIFSISKVSHNKSIMLAVLMTAVAVIAIWLNGLGALGSLTLEMPLLIAVYFIGIFYLWLEEKKVFHPSAGGEKESAWLELIVIITSGVVVVASGYWLANISDEIAILTGWGESFIGYLFLAIATSLPELVITISSLKLKAYDMAIANTIGSCFFNILMFAIADPFYDGDLLRDTSAPNIYLALTSIAMLLLTAFALFLGKRGKETRFAKYALLALYLIGSLAVFSPSG